MTIAQLHLFNGLYALILAAFAVLTRATFRRIGGATAGAAVCGAVAVFILASGITDRWWHIAMRSDAYFLMLLWIDFALCGHVFLLTWRIDRKFGSMGMATALFVAAVIGPIRDYLYLAIFPEWGSHAHGFAPVLGISAAYVWLLILGHGMMRAVAGPSKADRLARRPWEMNQTSGKTVSRSAQT